MASSDSRVFLNIVENLSKKFNIVIIDLSGHGQSEGEGYRNVVDHAFICGELLKRLDLGEWNIRTFIGGNWNGYGGLYAKTG